MRDPDTGRPVRTGNFPPVDVTIVGRPGRTDMEKKHYIIYSKSHGFGKTFHFRRLAEQYNIHFVSDVYDWTAVPREAQFLVFDDVCSPVCCKHNKLSFRDLCALTGGSAGGFAGTCKTNEPSFQPREDVQVILLSNVSPYNLYARWNPKLRDVVIETEKVEKLHSRFEVIRLDGSVEEDRVRATSPETWTEEQFLAQCKLIVANMCMSIYDKVKNKVPAYEWAVDSIVDLCAKRSLKHTCIRSVIQNINADHHVMWTFDMLYLPLGKKRWGCNLADARKELIKLIGEQTGRFAMLLLEDLVQHVAEHPSSAFHLCSFYANEPYRIDFSREKEHVFRQCLAVHNENARPEDEDTYRSDVFEKVWEVAKQEEEEEDDDDESAPKRSR